MNAIPTIDLRTWHAGGPGADALATEIDVALQRAGFLLVTGCCRRRPRTRTRS